ncbi:tripartite tricarboxylate transporter permease [Roseitranquillus sediminis]|uniref:tripartite tricarboxylate transporter permease n=1 Tax=Roseitranquillus sediminis TaxID=2809051 RepID=UPI001D0C0555|nr:tripartite tricarboxylate transporter permease [Roseitranquillus sediminis]MBM9595418.1 tripartite tricarboxylate transporter permease [Roseitranquillus sediminis]
MTSLIDGLLIALEPANLLYAMAGAVLGIVFGSLPGVSATLGIALLVPLTFGFDPVPALIFLGAVYCGAIYGGSISAILLNVPGTPAAVATMIDGYEMTKQGRGGLALGLATIASMIGGQVSALVLLFAAPLVSAWALEIRSAEFFWIVLFAMSTVGAIGTGSPLKGLLAAIVGLAIGTIGAHPLTGEVRYTFGELALYEGVPVVSALVGLFSISQVLALAEGRGMEKQVEIPTVGRLWPGGALLWRLKKHLARSSLIGVFVGLIPGAGADIASFIGRSEAHRYAREPKRFGHGSEEAIVGAEAANNGVVGGSLIPMLTLGIPGNAVTAALLGGLLIHGLIPGPTLFQQAPDVLYPFIFSLFIANAMFALIAFGALRYIAKIVLVPQGVVAPVVAALAVVGAYSFRSIPFDIWIMFAMGIFGYILRRADFPLAPIILGLILGPLAESNLDRVQTLAGAADLSVMGFFMQRWITIILMVLTVATVAFSFWRDIRVRRVEDTRPEGPE